MSLGPFKLNEEHHKEWNHRNGGMSVSIGLYVNEWIIFNTSHIAWFTYINCVMAIQNAN